MNRRRNRTPTNMPILPNCSFKCRKEWPVYQHHRFDCPNYSDADAKQEREDQSNLDIMRDK